MFSAALSRTELIELCRTLRHNLSAGLALRQVFQQLARRGPDRVRRLAARVLVVIERGDSFQSAIENDAALPQLFRSLAAVGEETGHLPEVLGQLEKYFILQQQLVRKVIAQSIAPIIQLVVAFLVVALLIMVLGMIAQSRGGSGPAVLGLSGAAGAVMFLVLSFGSIALLIVLFKVSKAWRQQLGLDAMLLRLPGVGPCLQAMMLGRLCLALHLTLDTPMAIAKALRLSLDVTGNPGLAGCANRAAKALRSRQSFAAALAKCPNLPSDFLAIVETAEEAGRLPEALGHQADRYYEEASHRLKALTTVLNLLIWLCYAIIMALAIFYIAGNYLNALNG